MPELADKMGREEITTSDGVRLYVEVKGKGTPCLYLHGGPGCGSYWMKKLSGEMLERRFQMIYLDQRGAGRSTSPTDGNYSLDRFVMDFEEVRTALGIQQWLTLGHSFGGILQMGYLERHPKIISGMMMLNCTLDMKDSFEHSWIPKACEFLGISDTTAYMDRTLPAIARVSLVRTKLAEQDLLWKMGFASPENEKILNATVDETSVFNFDFANATFTVLEELKDYWKDYRPDTRNTRVPVLFFFGKRDWMVGPTHYTGVHFPCSIMWPSDVGHVASLENKADLEKAIDTFQAKYRL